ncbi:hypothetical protein AAVH_27987, partial [Aphelenchoides avenae]
MPMTAGDYFDDLDQAAEIAAWAEDAARRAGASEAEAAKRARVAYLGWIASTVG